MRMLLHVLSVGSSSECNMVRDILLERQRCKLTAALSCNDLFVIPVEERFRVAILHPTLSLTQVRDTGAQIRRRWPQAKILVITRTAEGLEDPLYDEWTPPGLPRPALLALIERLAKESEQQSPYPLRAGARAQGVRAMRNSME